MKGVFQHRSAHVHGDADEAQVEEDEDDREAHDLAYRMRQRASHERRPMELSEQLEEPREQGDVASERDVPEPRTRTPKGRAEKNKPCDRALDETHEARRPPSSRSPPRAKQSTNGGTASGIRATHISASETAWKATSSPLKSDAAARSSACIDAVWVTLV